MAEQAGLDLSHIVGTGPHGRIVKADVDTALARGPAARVPAGAPQPAGAPLTLPSFSKEQVAALAGNLPYTELPHNNMRRVIARRMTEAVRTMPHFFLTVDCQIDRLLEMRKEIAEVGGVKVSVNDFVIRAAALALRKVPEANASWSEDAMLRWNVVNIAVAVATEGDGLITPIVKNADQKSLGAIAADMHDLGTRARAGKLKLEEFQGGTFSISNLGMYGIKDFTAVINPPHSCILAVGAGEQRPIVKDGALAVATIMSCTLACDHRVLNGAEGAQWLVAFKKFIETPATMLL
jgi:pyruvate dehydrogenase E2 component (dihydrolipoamide acetyltransferase)